jgi:hypothetical protein
VATREASDSPTYSASSRVGKGRKDTARRSSRFSRRSVALDEARCSVMTLCLSHSAPMVEKLTR